VAKLKAYVHSQRKKGNPDMLYTLKIAVLYQGYQYYFLGNSYKCLVLYPFESHVQNADITFDARWCLGNWYQYCQMSSSDAGVFGL
jgi:hypothetical protein